MSDNHNPWEDEITSWIEFNRSGKNVHRDYLNLPAFIDSLPPPNLNSIGLEIGGGEGTLARRLTSLGYRLHSTDISAQMIEEAKRIESESPQKIQYSVENAENLTFSNESFDFAISFMCIMDIYHPEKVLEEVYRVLKFGGYFHISMIHPCFGLTPHRKHVLDENGKKIAIEIGKYNEEGLIPVDWESYSNVHLSTFHNHLTLSHWIMLGINTGFKLEYIDEPYATEEIIKQCPHLEHTATVPDNLVMRFRK